MAEQSAISWTDATFNPWWGCLPVSPGCALCYAEREATRHGFPGLWKELDASVGAPPTSNRRTFGEKHWNEPRAWARNLPKKLGRRPRVFCASMADIGEDHPVAEQERPKLWRLIEETPELDWLLLTKRTSTAREWLPERWLDFPYWPANVWFGFSAEDQKRYDERVWDAQALRAGVTFVSYEPALGPIDFNFFEIGLGTIQWVIAGGESAVPAKRARPSRQKWFRSARDQCVTAGVAFHFKQHGEWIDGAIRGDEQFVDGQYLDTPNGQIALCHPHVKTFGDGTGIYLAGRKQTGRLLDGRTWDEFPKSAAA